MSSKRFHSGLMASLVLAIVISTPAVAQENNNQAMVDLVIQVFLLLKFTGLDCITNHRFQAPFKRFTTFRYLLMTTSW